MHSYTIRGIDDRLYKTIRERAEKEGLSINRYMLRTLNGSIANESSPADKRKINWSKCFGILTKEQADNMEKSLKEQRKIDWEMWK